MRKLVLVAHVSLDGFVAGPKGELEGFPTGDENLEFVCRLTDHADAALFGRTTYELLNSYWPTAKDIPSNTKSQIEYSNWYDASHKIVFSKTMTQENLKNTTIVNGNVLHEMTNLKKQSGKDILIFGSPSVSQLLMKLDLINSYWIFINPVIFGQGISLFTGTDKFKLRLQATKQFLNGEIALNYTVDR